MLTTVICIFLICFGGVSAQFSNVDINFQIENFKMVGEPSFFQSKIWTEYSKLLAVHDSDAFCEDSQDLIFPDASTKSLYYRCQNGRKELYQCIDGFEFNRDMLRCFPQEVLSNNSPATSDCIHQMDGFYPDYSSNCQKYFRCKNGAKVEMLTCPSHLSFSFHLQACHLKSEVTCVESFCDSNNDDFYVYPGSKCQAYYYCRRGIRSDFLCPKGSIFNRQSKTCVESGICYEPVCTGRIDGKYADTTHDCLRTFDCKGGALESVRSCPFGQKYNGNICIPPPFETCEKPEKTAAAFYFRANDECKALRDGSHIVPGTDCRNVRVCLRGKTSAAFECPRDQRFNGNRCFPKNLVSCDDVCSMKADGYYADEFTDCHGYYSCLKEQVFRRKQCPNGTAFNGYMCVPSHLVTCPKRTRSPTGRCLGLRDGFHPDYLNTCRNYFYCYNHEMVLQGSCSKGMIWKEKQCIETKDIMCDGPKEMEECSGLSPGLYQNKTSGCTKYFYCNNGSGTILTCPLGQLFNGVKCVNGDEYTCLSSDDCLNQPDGYKQDKNTACRSYYFCSNGNKITYVCPEGFVFNGTFCVSSDSYTCPYTASEDCVGKQDGYHPDKATGCRKYFYCFKGEKLTNLVCGGKKIFDGNGCVLHPNPSSVCLGPQNNLCRQKKDGTYTDSKSDCRRYFRCKNKTVIEQNWCSKGYGFNGSTCVKDFDCSSKSESFECDGQHIGFHQDLQSNCRNYFFCIGRTKTWASCPSGTIFNGQLCIDSNYYTCPTGKS